MPATLNKVDVEFDEFRIWRAQKVDPLSGETSTAWYVSVGYKVTTQEGEVIARSVIEEIKGGIKTKAVNLLTDVRNYILTKEGL